MNARMNLHHKEKYRINDKKHSNPIRRPLLAAFSKRQYALVQGES